MSVGLLDPEPLAVSTIKEDKDFSSSYLEFGLKKHLDKNFVMFAYNTGHHWLAVVIALKWKKVFYIESSHGHEPELRLLKELIDE